MANRFRSSELAYIKQGNGASFIYRENNSRYIGVQYSIEGRDLERAVARRPGRRQQSRHAARKAIAWIGAASTASSSKPSRSSYVIGPLALVIIFLILFALYGNFKFPVTIALGVVMTEPVGALLALKLTGHAVQRFVCAGIARADGRLG